SPSDENPLNIIERDDPTEDYKRPELLKKAIEEIEAEVAAKEAEGEDESEKSSSEDSDEEEDDHAQLLTPAVDSQIFRTIAAIRNKDPRVYEQDVSFFDDSSLDHAPSSTTKAKKERPVTLKDYERDILLKHGGFVDESKELKSSVKTHEQEQEELRNAFKAAAQDEEEDEEDEEDDFLTKKIKTDAEKEAEEDEYRKFLLEHMQDDEPSKQAFEEWSNYKDNPNIDPDDAFLMNYVLNRGWVDKAGNKTDAEYLDDVDKEKDEEYLDDVDRFESKYNFRFEEEGSSAIQTYARDLDGTVRRKESKRARKRAKLRAHKDALKAQKMEELKQQKNKKMKEIHEKLKEIRDITGVNASGLENIDLDADFDPAMFDAQMNNVFNDDYYEQGDADANTKPVWDDDIIDADYLPGGDKYVESEEVPSLPSEEIEQKKQKFQDLMDEYYSLNYEDVIGGDVFTRFKYTKTEPEDYGLTAEEILLADDAALNKYIGIKQLAP
ncbi:MAG: KRI1-like family-domain-containing protein, partial [Benjaminiella poitrasii]